MPSISVICCHCGCLVEEFRWRRLNSTVCVRCSREGRSDVVVQMPMNFDIDLAKDIQRSYVYDGNGNGNGHSSTINSIKFAVSKKITEIIKKKKVSRPIKEVINDA